MGCQLRILLRVFIVSSVLSFTFSLFLSFQKIHSGRCDTCLNTHYVYGLGRISNRGIFVLCVLLFCVALTALNVYELHNTQSDAGHVLPHPGQVTEKNSVKKPSFAVYGRNVSVYFFKF